MCGKNSAVTVWYVHFQHLPLLIHTIWCGQQPCVIDPYLQITSSFISGSLAVSKGNRTWANHRKIAYWHNALGLENDLIPTPFQSRETFPGPIKPDLKVCTFVGNPRWEKNKGLLQVHLELIKLGWSLDTQEWCWMGAQLTYFVSFICIISGLYLKPCSFEAKGESRPILSGITGNILFLFLISICLRGW